LGENNEGMSLGRLAERVGLPRSTVQRIVDALADEGLVMSASRTSPVRLGPGLLALAQRSRRDVMEIAHPLLKKLGSETGETIDLAILRGDHVVFVDQVIGAQRLRAVSAVGEHFPLHSTASGKACLALLNDTEIRSAVGERFDNGDGVGLDAFLAEIAEVRRTGLAFDDEEHSAGISAIGTAFRDSTGDIYAISIPAPTARARMGRERNAQLLLATRDELARLVGTPKPVAEAL
jgi:DNA-binding IclR family transcriptional regulator